MQSKTSQLLSENTLGRREQSTQDYNDLQAVYEKLVTFSKDKDYIHNIELRLSSRDGPQLHIELYEDIFTLGDIVTLKEVLGGTKARFTYTQSDYDY